VAGGSGQEQVVGTPVVGVPNNINPDGFVAIPQRLA
jgi:hypothetical protein